MNALRLFIVAATAASLMFVTSAALAGAGGGGPAPGGTTPTTPPSTGTLCAHRQVYFDGACRSATWVRANLFDAASPGGVVFGDGGSADAGHRIGILEELSLTSYQLVFISSERGSGAGTARGGYAIEAIERFNYDPTAADGPQVVVTELLPGAHGVMRVAARDSLTLLGGHGGGCATTYWEECDVLTMSCSMSAPTVCSAGDAIPCESLVTTFKGVVRIYCLGFVAGNVGGALIVGSIAFPVWTPYLFAGAAAATTIGVAACIQFGDSVDYPIRKLMDCVAEESETTSGGSVPTSEPDSGSATAEGADCIETFSTETYDFSGGECCGHYRGYACMGVYDSAGVCQSERVSCLLVSSNDDCSPEISAEECLSL
jgi:hypothetical protein